MADAISQSSKAQTSIPEISTKHVNPSKHFMYKASLVAIFLILLPLFPSQAPESFTQSRSWELIQLLFVGIAVSYGLFSNKNDEPEKESNNNAQSYVSKLLQVSSVFDDESENLNLIDENKVQNWNYSQYSRVEPVVLVAKESPKNEKVFDSRISEKPLLLPVRSLRNGVLVMNEIGFIDNEGKSRNSGFGNMGFKNLEEKIEENVVLRSPIPWRSRSGRMEIKEEMDLNSLESRSFKLKNSEDVSNKTNFSSPPPAPPPPPPPFLRKSMLSKSNPIAMDPQVSSNDEIQIDGLQLGKSVRTFKTSNEPVERKSTDYVMNFVDKKIPVEDKNKIVENVLVETSDDEDSDGEFEEDNFKESSENGEMGSTGSNDMGPDVDKKADEFIAKFREQIRQQRIESIRKSNAQRAGKTLR